MRRLEIDGWLWAGLALVAGGCACLGAILLLHIGRDDRGAVLLTAGFAGGIIGAVCAVIGIVRTRMRARRLQLPERGISK